MWVSGWVGGWVRVGGGGMDGWVDGWMDGIDWRVAGFAGVVFWDSIGGFEGLGLGLGLDGYGD